MYKLIIIDDEYNIREGIASSVRWLDYDIQVTDLAESGEEALSMVRATKPDIVITDIEMQGISGLDFIEKARAEFPAMKFIVISGYDQFKYAQRAIELGVFTYLLKPVLANELLEAVLGALQVRKTDEAHEKNAQKLQLVIQDNAALRQTTIMEKLLNGSSTHYGELYSTLEGVHVSESDVNLCCMLVHIDGYYDQQLRTADDYETFEYSLQKQLCRKLSIRYTTICLTKTPSFYLATCFADHPVSRHQMAAAVDTLRGICRSRGISLSAAISRKHTGLPMLQTAYRDTLLGMDALFSFPGGQTLNCEQAEEIALKTPCYPKEIEARITQSIRQGDTAALLQNTAAFFDDIDAQALPRTTIKTLLLELWTVVMRTLSSTHASAHDAMSAHYDSIVYAMDHFDSADMIKERLISALGVAANLIADDTASEDKKLISTIKNYMIKNFHRSGLSLDEVASAVCLQPSYLSKLFKRETSVNFIDYLTQLRIKKAKSLLRETNLKIQAVGKQTGYDNNRYFCTVFKKYTGYTPKEYRENII